MEAEKDEKGRFGFPDFPQIRIRDGKGYFPEGFLTADPDTTRYSVFSGKAAMDIDGQWFDSYIIDDGMNMDDFGTFAFPEARLSSYYNKFGQESQTASPAFFPSLA